MDWRMPQTSEASEAELFCLARDDIENFILTGGMPPWSQVLLKEQNLLTPRWEQKGGNYVAPGTPDDD